MSTRGAGTWAVARPIMTQRTSRDLRIRPTLNLMSLLSFQTNSLVSHGVKGGDKSTPGLALLPRFTDDIYLKDPSMMVVPISIENHGRRHKVPTS
jgi:hypothetical protein